MCGGGATAAAAAAVAKDFPEARLTSPAEEEAESLIVFSFIIAQQRTDARGRDAVYPINE